MRRAASDDLQLLATRLRLGIPLDGFDGRPIPLRDTAGRPVDPVDAAHELLRSGVLQLPDDQAGPMVVEAIERAMQVEAAAVVAGDDETVVTAKVAGVLVGAAIRAAVIARSRHASPSDLNHATLSWYHAHELQRRDLLVAGTGADPRRLSA